MHLVKNVVALVAFFIFSYTVTAQTLFPGDAAPELKVGKWVKGTPVNQFEKGKIYVVEFWATWCGPCKKSIPHLTELAKKYKNDVSIIGVSIAETNTALVEPFVTQMGDKMNYNVAIDQQESATARTGHMSKYWMEGAGLKGIPSAFIIGRNQKIEWIGYPDQMDSALKLIVENKWDAKQFAASWKKQNEESAITEKKMTQFNKELGEYAKAGNKSEFYKTFDNYLNFLVEDEKNGGWQMVNTLIWSAIADPERAMLATNMKDYNVGIKWMEKLLAVPGLRHPAFMDTLAWCYFGSGNKEKAIETEQSALAQTPKTDPLYADLEKSLEKFKG